MSRKKTNALHPEDAVNGASRIVTAGSIRAPDESDALAVKISIDDFDVDMRADRAEIGSWPTSTVTIRRIDDTSFEFVAEGDRLIFTPDDPLTFGEHPVVRVPDDRKRRRRRAKQKSDGATERSRTPRASLRERRGSRPVPDVQEAPVDGPARPSLDDRATPTGTGGVEAVLDPESVPEPVRVVVDDEDFGTDATPPVEERRRFRLRRRHTADQSGSDDDTLDEADDGPNRLWIRTIDVARRYDLLGLDRVPIDENLRGQEHQHTWNHRVATASGAGANICTICGKLRRKAEPSSPDDAVEGDE
ncbi:MAG: hypothetical protein U9R51_10900 [Actinomycetota bacterium]|nr:hypothetical protein [Actinomycetota bacterium]